MSTTMDVRNMYERYPYPSPLVGTSLIPDNVNMINMVFAGQSLNNKRILDAGCGTGHRLLAVAKRYKKAQIMGIDMTHTSLKVARQMAEKHGMQNLTFQEANILSLNLNKKFDIIYSSGVIHHLENPARGLENLCNHLSDSGVIIIWLYHSLGEHQRLLNRELLLLLAGEAKDNWPERYKIMRELGLYLEKQRYGSSSSQWNTEVDQDSIDADAYMHPIVNAYRFQEAIELFAGCDVDWLEIDSLNRLEDSKLIDLDEVAAGDLAKLCLHARDLFQSERLIEKYRSAGKSTKLKIIEAMLKPTGFTVIAGKHDSHLRLGERISGNILEAAIPRKQEKNQMRIKANVPESNYAGFNF